MQSNEILTRKENLISHPTREIPLLELNAARITVVLDLKTVTPFQESHLVLPPLHANLTRLFYSKVGKQKKRS